MTSTLGENTAGIYTLRCAKDSIRPSPAST
jgi:hypothetical protein